MTSPAAHVSQSSPRSMIESFYARILTAGGSKDIADDIGQYLAPDWSSIGEYRNPPKDRATFAKQVAGFVQLMPDLRWSIEEVIESGDRFVVRSRATGTPRGPMFGVEPTGRSFEIMTVDIHTVRDGAIVRTYHVEDWAGAIGQLRGK